jgi:type I restriction enzyme S subunit
MFRGEVSNCCFQNTLIRFRPTTCLRCLRGRFALLIFQHYLHSGRFQKIARWTVNIAHLGSSRFAELEFPLPPLPEQDRIVAKVEELLSEFDAGVAALKRVQSNLKRFRSAVPKAAMEGRLTESWRSKRCASQTGPELLERILKERSQRWEAEQLAAFAAAEKDPPKNWKAKYKESAAPNTNGLPPLVLEQARPREVSGS